MEDFFSADAEKDKTIRYLLRIIFGMFLCIIMALLGWMSKQNEIDLNYPPNLSVATTMKAGFIPEQTIYLFTPRIYQQLMLWQEDGLKDYENNRYRLRQFLTKSFQKEIRDEIEAGKKHGTLSNLTRSLSLLPTSNFYSDESVQVVGNHWIVWLDVEIVDRINNVPVNKSIRRLGLRVVRYDIDWESNPWQLAIDGVEQDKPLITEEEAKKIRNADRTQKGSKDRG